jgi:hypothetical protein
MLRKGEEEAEDNCGNVGWSTDSNGVRGGQARVAAGNGRTWRVSAVRVHPGHACRRPHRVLLLVVTRVTRVLPVPSKLPVPALGGTGRTTAHVVPTGRAVAHPTHGATWVAHRPRRRARPRRKRRVGVVLGVIRVELDVERLCVREFDLQRAASLVNVLEIELLLDLLEHGANE